MRVTTLRVHLATVEQDFTLRQLVQASGLSQGAMGRLIGLARGTVNCMCCGRMPTPRCWLLAALTVCAASGVSVIYVQPKAQLDEAVRRVK